MQQADDASQANMNKLWNPGFSLILAVIAGKTPAG
jgi:hypothetical protein